MKAAALRALFDPRGRVSRRAYGRVIVRAMLAFAILLCLSVWLGSQGLRIAAMLAFGSNLFVVLALLIQTVGRLHDRDRSAWWLALYGGVYVTSFLPIEDAVERNPEEVVACLVAMAGFSIWFFVETFLRRGTPGPNRFGPEPFVIGAGSG